MKKEKKSIFNIVCIVLLTILAIAIVCEVVYIIVLKSNINKKKEDIDNIPSITAYIEKTDFHSRESEFAIKEVENFQENVVIDIA